MWGPALITCAVTIFSSVLIGLSYFATAEARVRQFRSIYARLCIQLRESQATEAVGVVADPLTALFHPDVSILTSLDFIEDSDRAKGIVDQMDELAPALFGGRFLRLVLCGHGVAGIIAPLIGLTVALLIGAGESDEKVGDWPLLAMVGADGGVALSLLASMAAWHVLFGWNLSAMERAMELQPIWTPGRNRGPAGRQLKAAMEDDTYKALKK